MRSNILFIMHMPPPVHGSAMVGKYIQDSNFINKTFDCSYINLSTSTCLDEIGGAIIKKIKSYPRLLWQIFRTAKNMKPNLCYVTPTAKGIGFYKDFPVVMMLKLMRYNVVIHYHNKGVSVKQNAFFDNLLYKLFFKNIKVILLSNNLFYDIQKYVKPEDCFICPNGIPAQNVENKNVKLDERFRILFLSNMMKEKGVWDLLDACRILKENEMPFHVDFVGKWHDIDEYSFQRRVIDYDLTNFVTAHGGKYGCDKNTFFENADLFVFPSHNETFGLVLLEAMEYCIPCIGTNEGGIPSVIDDEKTGYLVEKNNPQSLADKITELINNPELCSQMGKAGKEKFEKEFTLECFENRMIEILAKLSSKTISN